MNAKNRARASNMRNGHKIQNYYTRQTRVAGAMLFRFRYFTVFCFVALLFIGMAAELPALESAGYSEGLAFGRQYAAQVQRNIELLMDKAAENKVDLARLIQYARESESLYGEILPEKTAWMKGVAEGSRVPYEHILLFNTVDKMITGFVGECTTLMAHGKALASGKGVIIAKNRDLGSQTLCEVGLKQPAVYPRGAIYSAAYIDIPQAEKTYKFVGNRSAGRWGYGMGVNEHQVIVADNDAPSRDLHGFRKSLHDNDLVRLVLERAATAHEGVDIIAALVPEFGQAWNGIIFEIGDPNELWVVAITGPRWVAKKYTNTVTARSNQYQIRDDYDLAAPDLVGFAVEKGWAPKDAEKIDFAKIYATDTLYPEDNDLDKRRNVETLYNTEKRYQRAVELLKAKEGALTLDMFAVFCRDHYDTFELPSGKVLEVNQVPAYSLRHNTWGDYEWQAYEPEQDQVERPMFIRGICHHGFSGSTAASGILMARPDVPNGLGLMLHAFMPPCNSTYVPFYVGITSVDPRYSGPEAAAAFQMIKARAQTQYRRYHKAIRMAFDPYEASLFKEIKDVEEKYIEVHKQGKDAAAAALLTGFVRDKCAQALSLTSLAQDYITQKAEKSSTWKNR